MPQEKNKKAAIVFWILTAVCMGMIFYFSSQTSDESTKQSNVFVEWLISLFGENEIWVFTVRKSAHCLEYTGLALLMNFALYYSYAKKCIPLAVILSSIYAITDEIHQIFVEGRSCQILDWAVDTVGALIGAAGFMIILAIINAIIKKKRKTK